MRDHNYRYRKSTNKIVGGINKKRSQGKEKKIQKLHRYEFGEKLKKDSSSNEKFYKVLVSYKLQEI